MEHISEVGHCFDGLPGSFVVGVDNGTGGDRQGPEPSGSYFEPQAVGHHILDLVGLIEHHDLVFGQHGTSAGEVGPVEVGVDHDDVGFGSPGAGMLGKAVPT